MGFLSNISNEKGIHEFLDLCAAVEKQGLLIRGRLAGPFQDASTEKSVRTRLAALPSVEYVGAVYGTEKDQFFNSIDVLVFPTNYPNEAEPLTILESLRAGVPVVAYGRGAIPELLDGRHGLSIPPCSDFVSAAMSWMTSINLNEASVLARQEFENLFRRSKEASVALVRAMGSSV